MGHINGKKQATLYVDPTVMQLIQFLAVKRGKPQYIIVDEALRAKIEKDLTPQERKVFGYTKRKEKKRGKSAARSKTVHP